MKRATVLAILASVMLASGASAKDRRPESVTLVAQLSGTEVVPGPGDPDGSGRFTATLERDSGELCYTLAIEGTWYAMSAHIHAGKPGEVFDVLVDLAIPDADGQAGGCTVIDKKLVKQLMLGAPFHYVDVHDIKLPGGSVRGQLARE